jgi:hypothetical protein
MPSLLYQQLAQAKDYNINLPGLTLVEKYCLLALSGNKFQLLDKHDL